MNLDKISQLLAKLGFDDKAAEHLASAITDADLTNLARLAQKVLLTYPVKIVGVKLGPEDTYEKLMQNDDSFRFRIYRFSTTNHKPRCGRVRLGLFRVHNKTTRPQHAASFRKNSGLKPIGLDYFIALCRQHPALIKNNGMVVSPDPLDWHLPEKRIIAAFVDGGKILIDDQAYCYPLWKNSCYVGLIDEQPL